ncbi:RagB/SusD family nutrient uptake outer membrane protein [Chitinophaga agrisoli]|uniref:RagB/SusD family nutrient uptake outer membrane protein n=1 Tax=Chitinophaga agrisoli TaxID=2607653 RepID=A0A5B2VS79_9BACT|nr:RagB/SusD family nutrient uptake outer membrane protein [Chitinophaga agrisoli]KAA2242623.1 RagB/SusD family nutrient uptake outer membrane protein [Chitinophaga agrisoli]
MKKHFTQLYAAVCILAASLLFGACKDTLDLKPQNAYSENDVWSDPKLTEVFVNGIYDRAVLAYKDAGFGWAAQTDELYGNFNWTNENIYVRGEATPDNQTDGSLNNWNSLYTAVRYCNTFFANIDKVDSSGNGDLIRRMKGEVYFLRAMSYFELLKRFGGVVLITKVYDVTDNTFDEKRATWQETKDFILADIGQAVQLLPANQANDADKGRATAGAALALKSRLLLYAASPYFNKSNDQQLWRDARDAAKAVIDYNGKMYSLYGNAANGTYNKTFLDLFNPEVIFGRVFSGLVKADRYNTVSRDLSPNGYDGYSAYNVIQQMVDEFEMADGSAFSWNNPAQAQNPYTNREPRFYADVLANNQLFKGRLTQFYEGGDDSPQSPFSPWNASKTRYCVRKMVDENTDWKKQEFATSQWVVFRLSEIYLNYAEACAALGEYGEARSYLDMLRQQKAGLPAVTAADAALMDRIRHERRIELCFEGHRYFDIRRWGIAEVGSEDAKGVIITKQANGSFTYQQTTVEERTWTPGFYFYPIPRTEIQKNPNITQNPDYN